MSERKICNKCQNINFCWQLGKKAHEKDDKYTIKEYYCRNCLDELDKTKCWKDYDSLWFIDEGGQGQEKRNYCSDRYNETERIDKKNKDFCKCQLRCDRHRKNPEYADWTSDCKACWKLRCQRGYHDWGFDKCDKCGCSPKQEREREREREQNWTTKIWNSAIRANY